MGLLTIGLRSARLVFAILVSLIVVLVLVTAFAIAALGSLNLISAAFAVLFIGLSVDFGIHFGMRFQEELEHAADSQAALERAGEAVGGPMTLCAVSASIAFYSFLPTDYVGLAELGFYDRDDTVMVSSVFAEDETAHEVSRYQLKTMTEYVAKYGK